MKRRRSVILLLLWRICEQTKRFSFFFFLLFLRSFFFHSIFSFFLFSSSSFFPRRERNFALLLPLTVKSSLLSPERTTPFFDRSFSSIQRTHSLRKKIATQRIRKPFFPFSLKRTKKMKLFHATLKKKRERTKVFFINRTFFVISPFPPPQ